MWRPLAVLPNLLKQVTQDLLQTEHTRLNRLGAFHGFPWLRTSYYATLLLYTSRSDSRIQQTTITSLVFATPQARPSPYDSLVDNPSVGSCELSLNCSEFWKRSSWVMVLVQSHNVVFVFWVFFFGGVGIINQFWIRNWNFNLIDHWKRYGLATV